jgi:hypothetical protein
MNITLRQYIEKADKIHNDMVNNPKIVNTKTTTNQLYELESYVKQIQTVSLRIAKIYNVCKKRCDHSVVLGTKLVMKNVDPFPGKNSWSYVSRIPDADSHSLAPNILINVKEVDTCDDIPNTPLYWVKSLNQFASHINGVILRGNIGNIYVRNVRNGKFGPHVKNCKHVNVCNYLLSGKRCKFYHDPNDVLRLFETGKISQETLNLYKNTHKNFTNISWLYTDDVEKKNNKMMRFVGSRNTLQNELQVNYRSDSEWVANYQSQVFHDFLVLMAINQHGLIKDHPNVQMVSEDYTGKDTLVKTFK